MCSLGPPGWVPITVRSIVLIITVLEQQDKTGTFFRSHGKTQIILALSTDNHGGIIIEWRKCYPGLSGQVQLFLARTEPTAKVSDLQDAVETLSRYYISCPDYVRGYALADMSPKQWTANRVLPRSHGMNAGDCGIELQHSQSQNCRTWSVLIYVPQVDHWLC